MTSLALFALSEASRYISATPRPNGTSARQIEPSYLFSKENSARDIAGTDRTDSISSGGWKALLRRTYKQISQHRILAVAAGVVFYGLLALFPTITALVSAYALFADARTINDNMLFLSGVLPQETFSVVRDQVDRVISKGSFRLGTAFFASFIFALWSANGGMKALIDALNVVYGAKEERGFFRLNAVSLLFTVGGIFAVLASIGLVIAIPLILAMAGFGAAIHSLIQFGRWPLLATFLLFGLTVLYRWAPDRRSQRGPGISMGAIAATMIWILGSILLSFYLENFAQYDATYGSLGAAIGLMVWMWMSTIVILMGGQLNAEITPAETNAFSSRRDQDKMAPKAASLAKDSAMSAAAKFVEKIDGN
jgi:membrane protein